MTGKRDIQVLTEILDLSDVKVISHRLHTGIGMILQIEQEKSFSTCPKCGTTSHKLHQNHRHIIKDLPFGEKEVFLEINRRQFKCRECKKPFSEDLDFVKKKRTYTKRLARKTIQEVLENDIYSVAAKGKGSENPDIVTYLVQRAKLFGLVKAIRKRHRETQQIREQIWGAVPLS